MTETDQRRTRRRAGKRADGLCALIAWLGFCAAAAGQPILVDHQPYPFGGLGSDTLFPSGGSGPATWQQVADDFVLSSPATVGGLVAWGFYNADNPPAMETMRVRFMEARIGDGLPDESNVVSEQSFVNPTRVATGEVIAVGILPHEYKYQMTLSPPVSLLGGRRYWLEFVQIGDLATTFRWEFSLSEQNGMAVASPFNPNWHLSTLAGDCAFQLFTIPEPASIAILGLTVTLTRTRAIR